jgi:hypothetical protein
MIRLSDTLLLATTKLRARKVRLIVTVVISSLLFGVLALSSFVVRGVIKSTNSFAEEGFGKRYILNASPISSYDAFNTPEVLDQAISLQKDEVARKKAEAKRLGIDYDANSEQPVYYEIDTPSGKQKSLDISHPLALKAANEYFAAHPPAGIPELKKLAQPYGAEHFYESRYANFGGPSNSGELKVLKDGKESFTVQEGTEQFNPFASGLDSFSSSWSLMSSDLLQTFTLEGTTTDIGTDGSIPIVAPYSAIEQLLKLTPLPASASPAARLERLREVRAKAADIRFSVCYRNQASSELITQAITTKREIEQNKNNRDYKKPSLIYELPTEACAPAKVARDVRTAEEKSLANKWDTFRRTFGEEAPTQTVMQFRVIGVAADPPAFNTAFVDGLISAILSTYLGANWFVPLELKESDPLLAKFFPDYQFAGQGNSYFVELPTAGQAKQLLKEGSCNPDTFTGVPTISEGSAQIVDIGKEVNDCVENGRPFFLHPFGSNSLALDDLQKGFSKVFRIAALIITAIAAIIMMGTVGRIIADSRRETAVFRAIGAKRIDIAQVYITYALAIASLVGITALVSGFVLSQIAEAKWGARFTVQALVAYNAQDLTRQFHLFAWSARDTAYIVIAAISAGLVSTAFPLLRNLRRNPIRDMRDEN